MKSRGKSFRALGHTVGETAGALPVRPRAWCCSAAPLECFVPWPGRDGGGTLPGDRTTSQCSPAGLESPSWTVRPEVQRAAGGIRAEKTLGTALSRGSRDVASAAGGPGGLVVATRNTGRRTHAQQTLALRRAASALTVKGGGRSGRPTAEVQSKMSVSKGTRW